ncbi:MAG TPA: SDR family oxidoreductase, partial [Acidimicrobiia bacterium]|nr:SDR family oxidoreductase [Acidimicrobiia bacterium]
MGSMMVVSSRVAVVTGASRGLGLALTRALVADGWSVIVDGRAGDELMAAVSGLPGPGEAVAIPGDVTDPDHRRSLALAATGIGPVRLIVNNASYLGPSPQPVLADYPLDTLRRVYEVNVVAPLALIQAFLPLMAEAE